MANLNLDDYLDPNSIRTKYFDKVIATSDPYGRTDATIKDIDGLEMLEVIQKGLYKTLVGRRDDAKAVWEEEDDDASYGEYKALKDTVELVEAFIRNAPNARYSGVKRTADYDRYDGYGRRY